MRSEGFSTAAVAVALALFVGCSGARADDENNVLATGGVYGGPTQFAAVCYVFNAGDDRVSISNAVIRDQSGNIVPPFTTNSCAGQTLNPGKTCALDAATTNQAYSCTITARRLSGLRGTMDIRGPGGGVFAFSSLR